MVDGAQFGLYDDDEPERRAPWAALGVLVLGALVVAGLVWRAVSTDATLAVPAGDDAATATTTTDAPADPSPTVDELRLLLPPEVEGCDVPADRPTDGPPVAVLRCTGPGEPTVEFSLYGTVDERNDAFDFVATLIEVPAGGGDCALGRPGRHDYVGVEQVGQLACQAVGGRTDLLWTSDAAPLLAVATGEGSYADQYRWWSDLVDRTDAAFPTRDEQAVLDLLPGSLLDDCDRDPDARLAAGGDLAVTCRPDRSPAASVTWIRFADIDDADRWLAARRQVQPDDVEAGCREHDYELGASTGRVLCHQDSAGRGVLAWSRDAGLLGSVVVGADGVAVADLLAWWERGGHLP